LPNYQAALQPEEAQFDYGHGSKASKE